MRDSSQNSINANCKDILQTQKREDRGGGLVGMIPRQQLSRFPNQKIKKTSPCVQIDYLHWAYYSIYIR